MSVAGPHPFAGHWWIKPYALEIGFFQIFETRRGIAESDVECWEGQLLLQLRYWNRFDSHRDATRFWPIFIPMQHLSRPAQDEENGNDDRRDQARMSIRRPAPRHGDAIDPTRGAPRDLAKDFTRKLPAEGKDFLHQQ